MSSSTKKKVAFFKFQKTIKPFWRMASLPMSLLSLEARSSNRTRTFWPLDHQFLQQCLSTIVLRSKNPRLTLSMFPKVHLNNLSVISTLQGLLIWINTRRSCLPLLIRFVDNISIIHNIDIFIFSTKLILSSHCALSI